MKHILGSCVLAGLFLFCACDDTLDTKVTWQIGDSDTWRVPELAQGVLYKAYNGIANRPDCFEDNFLDCATDNATENPFKSKCRSSFDIASIMPTTCA